MVTITVKTVVPKKNDDGIPFPPHCVVEMTEYGSDGVGNIRLTPELMTPNEVDVWIDDLIQKLNDARKKAKRGLLIPAR
jgi:hypothetical protein